LTVEILLAHACLFAGGVNVGLALTHWRTSTARERATWLCIGAFCALVGGLSLP
jgi:hypothetical protein